MRHLALTCTTLLVPLAAQEPSPGPIPSELLVPIHSGSDSGYGTWAAGTAFKVAFHGGFEFVPYLGAGHPHNLPWRWHTESVRIGDQEHVEGAAVGRRVRGDRYEYDLGLAVEAYDLSAAAVEQTFTIACAPAVAGELVVTGRVATPLAAPSRGMEHAPLRFAGPGGAAVVEYGAATAIDARGRPYRMTSSWDGQRVRLRLDAESVREAEFPLVVDPVVLSLATAPVGMAVVACPPASSLRIVCYTRVASASDHDAFALAFGDGWVNRSPFLTDVTAAYSTVRIACAGFSFFPTRGAVVAYERRYSNRTDLAVVSPTGSQTYVLPGAAGVHLRNPSVSEGTDSSPTALIVYDQVAGTTTAVRAALLYQDGGLLNRATHFVPLSLTVLTSGGQVAPRIARSDPGDWRVYWADNGATESRLLSRTLTLDRNGNFIVVPGTDTLVRSTRYTFHDPLLAGASTFLTYHRVPRGIGIQSVVASRFVNGAFGSPRTMHAGKTYVNGGLAADPATRSHAVAAYVVKDGTTRDARFERLGSDARVTATMYATAAGRPFTPDVAFATLDPFVYVQHGEFVGVWATETSGNPLHGEEFPYPIEPFRPLVVLGTPDCGGTNELDGFRKPSLAGHELFDIQLREPANLAVLLIGLGTASISLDPIGMTGCYLNVQAFASITASPYNQVMRAPLPLSSAPSIVGTDLIVQWVWDDAAANPLGLVSSSAVKVRIR